MRRSWWIGWGLLWAIILGIGSGVGAVERLTVRGELDGSESTLDGAFYDLYILRGTAGEVIVIELESNEFDPFLNISNGRWTRQVDDSDGVNAGLVVTLPESGRYVVFATSSNPGDLGRYELRWRTATSGDVVRFERQTDAFQFFHQGREQERAGQYREASHSWRTALEIYRSLGKRRWESLILNNLCSVNLRLETYEHALASCSQSLDIARELDDRWIESSSLVNLGATYSALGDYKRALYFYSRSWPIKRAISDRQGES